MWPFRACAMHPAIIIETVRSLWTWLLDRQIPRSTFHRTYFQFSITTNSFFSLNMLVVDIYYCLKLIVCDILLSCVCHWYFTCCMLACNLVRLSLESIKGNLLTYLLTYLLTQVFLRLLTLSGTTRCLVNWLNQTSLITFPTGQLTSSQDAHTRLITVTAFPR